MALGTNPVNFLFLYSLQTNNGFTFLYGQEKKKSKE